MDALSSKNIFKMSSSLEFKASSTAIRKTPDGKLKSVSVKEPSPKTMVAMSQQQTAAHRIKYTNPFRMPSDDEVFAMREAERIAKVESKRLNATLRIHEKTKRNARDFRDLLAPDKDDLEFIEGLRKKSDNANFLTKSLTGDNRLGNENLRDLVEKKREMFFLQYSLGVKKDEITKLEEIAQAEEQKLLEDEKALEEDAAKFDAFLKENDKNSVEAIKKAEAETKAKLEKVQEIKKLNTQIMVIRSEMSKNEDQLRDYKRYRAFLDKLTPSEWFVTHPRHTSRASAKVKSGRKVVKVAKAQEDDHQDDLFSMSEEGSDFSSDEEEADPNAPVVEGELYFKHPQQLMNIFAELEENNLSLIQSCQETEETLEELRKSIEETESKMERETMSLRQQIESLNQTIGKEEEKASFLEEKAKLFSSGFGDAETQDKLLEELNQRVKEAYQKCFNDQDATISTLQMLTTLENKLEQLFEIIEMMPTDKVEQAERLKDKERRQRLREQKMEAQRILQEERVQRALERARAPVKKKSGKPLIFRSAPPLRKKKMHEEAKTKEDEDLVYYLEGDE